MNCPKCHNPLFFKGKTGVLECGFLHITNVPVYACQEGHEFLRVDRFHIALPDEVIMNAIREKAIDKTWFAVE